MSQKETKGKVKIEDTLIEPLTLNICNKSNIYEDKKQTINYKASNILSKLFFWWSIYPMKLSKKGKLNLKDITNLDKNQQIKNIFKPLEESWNYYYKIKKYNYALIFSLISIHWKLIINFFLFEIILMIHEYINIYLIREIILHFSTKEFDNKNSEFYFTINQCGIIFFISKFIRLLVNAHIIFCKRLFISQITNEITALLYNKLLKFNSNNHFKQEGEIISLVENDANRVANLFLIGPSVIISPFKIFIPLYLFYKLLGKVAFFFTILSLIIVLSLIFLCQFFYLRNLKNLLYKRDDRIKLVTNTFHMIKQIKLNGLDEQFIDKIKNKRDTEISILIKNIIIFRIKEILNSNINLIMQIVSKGNKVFTGQDLEYSFIFTTNQLIMQIIRPLHQIPNFITSFFSNLISIRRLQEFLFSQEHNFITYEDKQIYSLNNTLIKYDNVDFGVIPQTFTRDNIENKEECQLKKMQNNILIELAKPIKLLKNITLEIQVGEFVAIIGKIGSGKTCLLKSFMNEYSILKNKNVNKGNIIINGSISYISQQPWIINDTIRNNILFYNEFNENKYNEILNICKLNQDLNDFPLKDLNIINSTGGNVSGGQRARISLARCLYRNSDIYLLDDPLSSIDSKISKEIFINVFINYLKNKTRIMVINDIEYLKYFDKIIYMDKGEILFIGTLNEYINKFNNFEFNSSSSINSNHNKDKNNGDDDLDHNIFTYDYKNLNKTEINNKLINANSQTYLIDKYLLNNTGKINMILYHKYIKFISGYSIFTIIILLIIISRTVMIKRQEFMANWSKSVREIQKNKQKENFDKIKAKNDNKKKYINYIEITFIGVFLSLITNIIISFLNIKTIKLFHEQMINKLIKAPINLFHDLINIGQILIRLIKDIENLESINRILIGLLRLVIHLISSIYVCYKYSKISLYISPILIIYSILLANYYISAGRNLIRLNRKTYSPIINIYGETFNGLNIIRIHKNEIKLTEKIYKRIDEHFGVMIYILGSNRWYLLLLQLSCHLFYGLMLGYIIYYKEDFTVKTLSLILNYTSQLNNDLTSLTEMISELEKSMVNFERCEAFLNIPSEKEDGIIIQNTNKNTIININNNIKMINCPFKGKIKLTNFSARYRPNTPIVLKDINLEINPGEKFGIIGRTGSGKTSIVLSICRIIESLKGKIEIDDYDISQINIKSLRQNITVIPQEPFIIEGTLKDNINLSNQYSDKDLISIVNDFNLFSDIEDNKKRLNFHISENGNNLSIGQKQIICIIRAILKKNKIIILDEATASLDIQTEKIVTENLKKYFFDCTVIIIAHHIQIVKECQRIAIIDNGKIIKCDTYNNLFLSKDSQFYHFYRDKNKK